MIWKSNLSVHREETPRLRVFPGLQNGEGTPGSLPDKKCIAVVRCESPALRAKAEEILLLGWYRGNTSRPFVVDRGFFDQI